MEFLSIFKKRKNITLDNSHVIDEKLDSFANSVAGHLNILKHDINLQKKWVDYLHSISNKIHDMHSNHKELTKNDMNNVKSWINHIFSNQKKQENDIKKLENDLLSMVNQYKEISANLQNKLSLIEQNLGKSNENIKSHLLEIINEKFNETEKKLNLFEENINKSTKSEVIDDNKFTNNFKDTMFTNPERKLLNILLDLPDPISYSKLAQMTGNSVNTVRVIMNSLKKKDVIEENLLPSGEKLFNAKNKEKIKKIYNIECV
ncbi:MAG: winged helix-turn-helix transcriptional regulator [Nanoarchaeota archaeon]